jgi:hypothetical protein
MQQMTEICEGRFTAAVRTSSVSMAQMSKVLHRILHTYICVGLVPDSCSTEHCVIMPRESVKLLLSSQL